MRKIIFAAILLALSIGVAEIVLSHGGEQHDATKDTIPAPTEPTENESTFKQALDSTYGEITVAYKSVKPILKNSCYDCHSAQTVYPWYHSLPLVGGFLDGHIKEAREHIDFSNDFPFGGHAGQIKQLQAIKKEIEEGEMPLWSYQIMHWNSEVEGTARDSLFEWIDTALSKITGIYTDYNLELPTE